MFPHQPNLCLEPKWLRCTNWSIIIYKFLRHTSLELDTYSRGGTYASSACSSLSCLTLSLGGACAAMPPAIYTQHTHDPQPRPTLCSVIYALCSMLYALYFMVCTVRSMVGTLCSSLSLSSPRCAQHSACSALDLLSSRHARLSAHSACGMPKSRHAQLLALSKNKQLETAKIQNKSALRVGDQTCKLEKQCGAWHGRSHVLANQPGLISVIAPQPTMLIS